MMIRDLIRILAVSLVSSSAFGAPIKADVTFTATAKPPIGSWEFEGEGATATGDDKGIITVRVADFKTGMSGRDDHMQKVLAVKLYPLATFKLKNRDAKVFNGALTLRGVEKPVSGQIDGKVATFKIKLTDFGIKAKELEGPGVNVLDVVTVQVTGK